MILDNLNRQPQALRYRRESVSILHEKRRFWYEIALFPSFPLSGDNSYCLGDYTTFKRLKMGQATKLVHTWE
jgi:hypothetical protein